MTAGPEGLDPARYPGERSAVLAGWWRRAAAGLIDTVPPVVLGVPPLVLGVRRMFADVVVDEYGYVSGVDDGGYLLAVLGLLAALVVDLLNRVVLQARGGRSIGKAALALRLVPEDRDVLTLGTVVGRWAGAVSIGFVPVLWLVDVLWPLGDSRRRTLHDILAHTLVVRS